MSSLAQVFAPRTIPHAIGSIKAMSAVRTTLVVVTAAAASWLTMFLGIFQAVAAPLSLVLPPLALVLTAVAFGTLTSRLDAARIKRGLWGCLIGLILGIVIGSVGSSTDAQGGLEVLLTAPAGLLIGAILGPMLRIRR